jgi:hypothetical protein
MGGAGEVIEYLAPRRVFGGAAAMAFVDDDQVEEIRRELLVDVLFFFVAGDRLIEREIDFEGLVGLPVDDLGHRLAEGLEVVGAGLVGEDVAVDEEKDAFSGLRLPQPPDDLEGGIRFSGAGRHDQQDALLSAGDGFDGAVDSVDLVVARGLAAAVVVIGRFDGDALFRAGDALPGAVALPEFGRRREGVERELLLDGGVLAGAVVNEEGVAVAAYGIRHVEGLGVVQALLHAVADGVVVVLGLDDSDGQVGGVVEDVVGPLLLAPRVQLAPHDDAALGEGDFFTHLRAEIPARPLQRGGDELGADIALGEAFLVGHGRSELSRLAAQKSILLRHGVG